MNTTSDIRYLQLGNGGGLNPIDTNSSFLIQVAFEEYLLFDCGFNIMERLIRLEKEDPDFNIGMIKYIFVSHVHDDHVGNLETIMFWNFFKNNTSMTFYYGNEEVLSYLKNKIFPKMYNGGRIDRKEKINSKIREIVGLEGVRCGSHKIISLKNTFHGDTLSNGIIIYSKDFKKALVISGDTKASSDLEEEIVLMTEGKKLKIFHDFSSWDCPSKNVHACETDIQGEYSKQFRNSIEYYHNGESFNGDWQVF